MSPAPDSAGGGMGSPGKPRLRPVDGLLAPAVAETLRELDLADPDVAAARLATTYAKAIDDADGDPDVLKDLGPKLLACLVELGATPRARAVLKGGAAGQAGSKLTALRAARGAS